MKKIKTAELIGPPLDWAVAITLGWISYPDDSVERGSIWHCEPDRTPFGKTLAVKDFTPSTDPAQAWPIIECKGIGFHRNGKRTFAQEDMRYEAHLILNQDDAAICRVGFRGTGPTALIAAMRCHVTSELGAEIEVPDELIEE